MKRSRILKAVVMVVCVAALSAAFAGVAFAGDQDVLKKQQEIDRYLFEEHADEIAAMNIVVTHTAPMDTYVEIGISPYTDESADYLYGIFGRDMVKVIEGEQAVIFTCGTGLDNGLSDEAAVLDTGDAAISYMVTDIPQDILDKQAEIDKYLFEDHKDEIAAKGITVTHTAPMDTYVEIGITPYSEASADYLYGIFGTDTVKVVEGQQAYPLEAAQGNLVSTQDIATEGALPVWPIALAAAAVVAGGTAFIMIRKKAKSR